MRLFLRCTGKASTPRIVLQGTACQGKASSGIIAAEVCLSRAGKAVRSVVRRVGPNVLQVDKVGVKRLSDRAQMAVDEQAQGYASIRKLCDELNRQKIATAYNKGQWHIRTVNKLLKQIVTL